MVLSETKTKKYYHSQDIFITVGGVPLVLLKVVGADPGRPSQSERMMFLRSNHPAKACGQARKQEAHT